MKAVETYNQTIPSSNFTELHREATDYVGRFYKGEIGANTTFKMQRQILTDKIDDHEFLEFVLQ